MVKRKNTVFCIYSRHLSIMLLVFVSFCIVSLLLIKQLLTPFLFEEVSKSVRSSFNNKESYLIMLLLSNATEDIDKTVIDDSFIKDASSKQVIPFSAVAYEQYKLKNNCRGIFKELEWADVCINGESALFEIPIKSADNTLAHLKIGTDLSLLSWTPYRVIRTGLFLMIVFTVLLYFLLLVRFYGHFAKPIKTAMSMLRTKTSKMHEITQKIPIGELYELASEIERNTQMAAVGQISSHIAHDMRSPLSVLEAYVKNEGETTDSDEKEFKTAAARSVKKLIHMADDLVNYAKAAKVERTAVDLNKFMNDSVMVETRSKSLEKNVRIRFIADNNIYANIDPYKMGRVMINLVNNSIQAISHDHGEIAVTAKVDNDDTLVIEVEDNGKGIEKDHIPHIFDSFFTVGKVKGIGLGLSYCKQVVEAHGGTIDVESEVGKGAKFTIKIPNCIARDYKPVIESKTAKIDYIGRRFLVVDDNEDIRRNWKRIIEDNGGQVAWEAASSNDIIKGDRADVKAIDAAIVDYNFPDSALTGVDIIKHLRSRGIKEIHLCTGFADDENIRNAALSAGATSVIGKG